MEFHLRLGGLRRHLGRLKPPPHAQAYSYRWWFWRLRPTEATWSLADSSRWLLQSTRRWLRPTPSACRQRMPAVSAWPCPVCADRGQLCPVQSLHHAPPLTKLFALAPATFLPSFSLNFKQNKIFTSRPSAQQQLEILILISCFQNMSISVTNGCLMLTEVLFKPKSCICRAN